MARLALYMQNLAALLGNELPSISTNEAWKHPTGRKIDHEYVPRVEII